MRLLESYRQAPAFARADADSAALAGRRRGYRLLMGSCVSTRHIPSQADVCRHGNGLVVDGGLFNGKGKAHTVGQPLRQFHDLALHHDIALLQMGGQDGGCIVAGSPAGAAKGQQCRAQQQSALCCFGIQALTQANQQT